METLVLENKFKIVVPLIGAAYAAPNIGTTFFILIQSSIYSAKSYRK